MPICDSVLLPDDFDLSECGRLLCSSIATGCVLSSLVLSNVLQRWPAFAKARLLPRAWTRPEDLLRDAKSESDRPIPTKRPDRRKKTYIVCASIIACAIELRLLVRVISEHEPAVAWVSQGLCSLAWAFIAYMTLTRRLVTPPYGRMLLAIVQLLDTLTRLRHRPHYPFPLMPHIVLALLTISVIGIFFTLPLAAIQPSARVAEVGKPPSDQHTSPEDSLSLFDYLTVRWVGVLLSLSKKRQVNFNDLWQRSPYNQTSNLLPRFQQLSDSSLLWKLLRVNALDITTEMTTRFLSIFFAFSGPYLLNRILSAFGSNDPAQRNIVYSLAFIALLTRVIQAELELVAGWAARRVYERSRQTLVANAHAKALRRQIISGTVATEEDEDAIDQSSSDIGRILNIAQNDSWRISQMLWDNIAPALLAPVQILVASVLLYRFLGWSAFAGVAVFFVATLITLPAVWLAYRVDRRAQRATDKRISIVSEILNSISLLKQLAWEDIWLRKAEAARRKELRQRLLGNGLDVWISLIWSLVPGFMPLAAFYCMIKFEKRPLTVPIAFPSLALLEGIRFPLAMLPEAILRLIRVLISCRRVQRFYDEPEVEPIEVDQAVSKDAPGVASMSFDAGAFVYPSMSSNRRPFELRVPAMSFTAPSLSLICGPTGSGKTSLLHALLGEMRSVGGHLKRSAFLGQHDIAYAGQQAWLEQATIRDNICLAAPYDAERFQKVIFACALEPDLRELSHRDLTEIGERGVSLSGGQQARVALARAVYSHATFVLLDDPLSAVDVDSARHIVEHCLKGPLLKDRCVLLTTHHEALCQPIASRTLRLDKGIVRIEEKLVDVDEPGLEMPFTAQSRSVEELLGQALPPGQEKHKLIDEEYRETGAVKWAVYQLFLRSSGVWLWTLVALALVLEQAVDIAQRFLLKVWSEGGPKAGGPFQSFPHPDENANPWLLAYLGIFLVGRSVMTTRNLLAVAGSYRAAKVLFITCLEKVMSARMRWFDTTPTGRIANRLTGDIGIADSELSWAVRGFLETLLAFIASLLVVIWLVPAFAPVAVVLFIAYWRFAQGYRSAFRDIRRLERVAWSPMFSSFGNVLEGLAHIRAFGLQKRYQDKMNTICDVAENCDRYKWVIIFWLRLRFDLLSALLLFFVTILAYASGVDQGFAAFGILSASTFVNALHQIIFSSTNLEKDLAAVERLDELLELDAEKLDGDEQSVVPSADWPSSTGEGVEYDSLVFRYAPELAPALRNISLRFGAREKVGIVGRTGSGKSSLVNSLLRLVEPAGGQILVDGLSTGSVSLRTLRSRITTVPQRATLFAGSLRQNLDPLNEHVDADLSRVLERVHLEHWSLDDTVDASGTGVSLGEAQLVCLARALLRKSNIIIFDESTSAIDMELDRKLQRVIREELKDCLLIAICHRINTVIDYDRIVVLSKGQVVEQGSPAELLHRSDSALRMLCERSGQFDSLLAAAQEAEHQRTLHSS